MYAADGVSGSASVRLLRLNRCVHYECRTPATALSVQLLLRAQCNSRFFEGVGFRLKTHKIVSEPVQEIAMMCMGLHSWAEPDFRYLRREVGIHSNTQTCTHLCVII